MASDKVIKKGYESEITRFLKEFDERPEATSDARKAEEAKYRRVHELRDNPDAPRPTSKIWKDF